MTLSEVPGVPGLPAPVAPATLTITAWPDPVVDQLGHDPRTGYVEEFWLAVLGPSTTLLLRKLADGLEGSPDGYTLDTMAFSKGLGLGNKGGRHSPLMRSLARCCQFRLAQRPAADKFVVRRKLPPLTRGQVLRLPDDLQKAHDRWQADQLRPPAPPLLEARARRLAVSLLDVGESASSTVTQLHRWRFAEPLATAAVEWAVVHCKGRDSHYTPPLDAA